MNLCQFRVTLGIFFEFLLRILTVTVIRAASYECIWLTEVYWRGPCCGSASLFVMYALASVVGGTLSTFKTQLGRRKSVTLITVVVFLFSGAKVGIW